MKYFFQLQGHEKLLIGFIITITAIFFLIIVFNGSKIECSKNIYNCSDFSTYEEAYSVFKKCEVDIHNLDGDKDGIPCEILLK